MFKDGGEKQAKRLDDLVSRALLNDLQGQGSHLALELPEIDLEATVLSRLAILEVLCKSQAQTISILQAENSRLTSLAASTSKTEGDQQDDESAEECLHPSFVPFKGSSHTLESCAVFEPLNAAVIPARHCSRSSQQAHLPSPVHTLSSPASPLRPLQREEFLAKLPKVVVKGGQLLPIRSCIEAFLKGDETALQSTMGSSSAELQQMLARMIQDKIDINGGQPIRGIFAHFTRHLTLGSVVSCPEAYKMTSALLLREDLSPQRASEAAAPAGRSPEDVSVTMSWAEAL
ncbi:MAG: hypothetical protein FRX49_03956 [Trebouxia sp. A1-2]|nr:MAG: hypothetical protein FRX49_03956 [Trebouxia sp. A1-2]